MQTLQRTMIGAIAGVAGTVAMSALMLRLFRHLPAGERYPLPPREITERVVDVPDEERQRDLSLAAHVAFGAGAGALSELAGGNASIGKGVLAGLAVWLASYFGWVPASRILRPASRHPLRRNLLMIAAHVVWGGMTAHAAGELKRFRELPLRSGPLLDAA